MLNYATNAQIRRDLLDAFVEAAVPEVGYRALFPLTRVESRAGAIKVLPFGNVGTPTSITRSAGSAYEDISMQLTSVPYQCSDIGLSVGLDMAEEYPLNMEMDAAKALRQRLEAQLELQAQDLLWNTATGAIRAANGNLTTLADPFSDPNVDPIPLINSARENVASATGGYLPNVAVMGPDTFGALIGNPNFVNRYPATSLRAAEEIRSMLAEALGVDKVVISRVRAGGGGYAWSDTLTLAVAASDFSTASEASACRFVFWPIDGEPDSNGWILDTVDDELTRSHYVRAHINGSMLVVSHRGLYGLSNTV